MGANYEGQEAAIEELKGLSPAARKFLSHHLRNSLHAVIGGIQMEKPEIALAGAHHIVEDLESIGC